MSFIAPIHEAMLYYMAPFTLAAAFIAMSYYSVTFRPLMALKLFIWLGFCGVMFFTWPVQVGAALSQSNILSVGTIGGGGSSGEDRATSVVGSGGAANISAVFHGVNSALDQIASLIMSAVDKGLGRYGEVGDMGAPMLTVTHLNRGYYESIRDSGLEKVLGDYQRQCSSISTALTKGGSVEGREIAAGVGLLERSYPVPEFKPPKNLVDIMTSTPLATVSKQYGYRVESQAFWTKLLATKDKDGLVSKASSTDQWYLSPDSSLQNLKYKSGSDSPKENEAGAEPDTFYPKNCYEMYQLADLGNRQFATTVDNATGDIPKGLKGAIGTVIARCGFQHLASIDKQNRTGLWSKGVGYLTDSLGSSAMAFATDWAVMLKKIDANVYTLFFPATLALLTGAAMIIFPIVVVMSIFPGRETSLPNFLLGLVFIKLTLVFTYFFLKVGGLIGNAAAMKIAINPIASNLNTDSLCGLASAALPGTFIAALVGAPLLAWVVTFNDKAGIRSLGFHSFGAQQMLSTGLKVAGAAALMTRGAGAVAKSMQKSASQAAAKVNQGSGGGVPNGVNAGNSGQASGNAAPKPLKRIRELLDKNKWK